MKLAKRILEKDNLIIELPLTPSEAALGCKLKVDGIDTKVDVNILAGTCSGEEIRVNGMGYFDGNGKRGDLIARTKIIVPKKMSQQQVELYQKLQEITSFVPR